MYVWFLILGTFNTEEDLRRNRGEWNKKVQRKQKHPQGDSVKYGTLEFLHQK